MPVARDHISSSVVVIGSRILVLGGETSHNVRSKLVSAYSPATNTWAELTPLPVTKAAGVAAVLNGNIYYTGGNFSKTNYKGIPGVKSIILPPVADAFVRNGSYAAKNYGGDPSLDVKTATTSGYTRSSYLKFSLSNVSSISSAKLRIYGLNSDNTTTVSVSAYGVNTDSWTENGITFNNAPATSTSALSSAGVNNTAKYYELDVTNYVKTQLAGDKIVSLVIKIPTNQNSKLVFNSRQNTNNKPQLVVVSSVASRSGENIFSSEKPILYPNPLKNKFNIRFPSEYKGDFNFEIVDVTGRMYNLGKIRVQPGGSPINIDISKFSLRAGVYFLKINSITKKEVMKLIIQ
jgi:hypothetical protein